MTKRGRFIPSFPAEGSTAVLDENQAPKTVFVGTPEDVGEFERSFSQPETAPVHPDIGRLEAVHALTGGQDGSVDPSGTFTPETAPEVTPAPAATPQNPSSESPDALRARLAAIPQETLRKLAVEHQGGAVTLPDGSVRIPVTIPAEMVQIIGAWADGAGLPFEEYLESHVLTCLTSGTLA